MKLEIYLENDTFYGQISQLYDDVSQIRTGENVVPFWLLNLLLILILE